MICSYCNKDKNFWSEMTKVTLFSKGFKGLTYKKKVDVCFDCLETKSIFRPNPELDYDNAITVKS